MKYNKNYIYNNGEEILTKHSKLKIVKQTTKNYRKSKVKAYEYICLRYAVSDTFSFKVFLKASHVYCFSSFLWLLKGTIMNLVIIVLIITYYFLKICILRVNKESSP